MPKNGFSSFLHEDGSIRSESFSFESFVLECSLGLLVHREEENVTPLLLFSPLTAVVNQNRCGEPAAILLKSNLFDTVQSTSDLLQLLASQGIHEVNSTPVVAENHPASIRREFDRGATPGFDEFPRSNLPETKFLTVSGGQKGSIRMQG